jgi:hypothetical protein
MNQNCDSRVTTSMKEQDIDPSDTASKSSDHDHPTMIDVDWDIEWDSQKRCWQRKH